MWQYIMLTSLLHAYYFHGIVPDFDFIHKMTLCIDQCIQIVSFRNHFNCYDRSDIWLDWCIAVFGNFEKLFYFAVMVRFRRYRFLDHFMAFEKIVLVCLRFSLLWLLWIFCIVNFYSSFSMYYVPDYFGICNDIFNEKELFRAQLWSIKHFCEWIFVVKICWN